MPRTQMLAGRGPWRGKLDAAHWRVLTASLFGRLFDGYETYILFVVLSPALRNLLSPEQLPQLSRYAGMVLAATVLGRSIGGIAAGIAADYIGRKRTLLLSFLLYGISTLLTGLAPGWAQLALFRLFTGVSLGGGLALAATLIAESWPAAARSRGQSFMQSAFGVGALLASGLWFLLESLAGPAAWRWPFFLGVAPAFFLFLYTRRNVPESERWLQKHQERKELHRQRASAASLSREQAVLARFTVAALFRDPQLRRQILLCIVMSLGTVVGYWAVASWIPAYVDSVTQTASTGQSIRWGAITGAAYGLGSIPGYLVAGWLADAIGRRGMLACFFTGSFLATPAVYLWSHSPLALMGAVALHGFFTQGQFVWYAIYPPELFPTAVRSTALSTIFNSARFLSLFGPLFAGVLITRLGGYGATAMIFSSVYLLALCAIPFLPETKDKPLPS